MARPNVSEELNESTEYLKRRFIRQNRELARINAAQAIQLRALEAETSRLLAENILLREKLIHVERGAGTLLTTSEDDLETHTASDETRATKPERIAPEPNLETINEDISPVRVSYIRRPPRREKPPKVHKSPFRDTAREEPDSKDSPVKESPVNVHIAEPFQVKDQTLQHLPVPKSPVKSPPKLVPLRQDATAQHQPVSPTREPLAPKTRRAGRAARVSYVEPSLKKKMRRSDIYANAVITG